MGYDLTRFVGEIDKKFQCSICSMIFKNPVQTPCGHVFCDECIITWLLTNTTCPISRTSLSQKDLKTPGTLFFNLLAKLKINCDFGLQGCKAIVELGHLQNHLTTCIFNPNSENICDKGCNGKFRRSEHQTHNCLTHLSNLVGELLKEKEKFQLTAILQEEENRKLEKMEEQQNTEIRCLKQQIIRHNEILTAIRHEDQNKKLEEVIEEQNNDIQRLKERLAQHNDMLIPKWKVDNNLRFFEESSILECKSKWGHGQSNYPLKPESSSFVVEVLNIPSGGVIAIGLAPEDLDLTDKDSIYFDHIGYITYKDNYHSDQVKWGVGDIVECGIEYPHDFNENQSTEVVVYYSKNGNLVHKHHRILSAHLFPSIYLSPEGAKVKVNYNVTE